MLKKLLFVALLLNNYISFSQDLLSSIPLELKGNRDVFQIVDNSSKKTILFLSDRKKVNSVLLNSEMNTLDTLSVKRPEKKYSEIVGFCGERSKPTIFWSSSNFKELCSQEYDFKTHQVENKTYKLDFKAENHLQFFSENQKLYILNVIENSSKLKLYVFDGKENYEEKIIDFSNFSFSVPLYSSSLLSTALKDPDAITDSYTLERIISGGKTSLVESSKKRKCYVTNNQIAITLDIIPKSTQLITIDLETYTPNLLVFSNPEFPKDEEVNSNSFLIDNKLFQLSLSSSKMFCTVKDLKGNLIKEYTAEEGDSIKFKNSEIIRLNSYSSSKRVLEQTSQFLNKVNNDHCGISCFKDNDTYLVTVGSVSNIRASGGGMGFGGMPGMGMPIGGAGFGNPQFFIAFGSFNSSLDNFNSYANRKVVFINCLFDKDGNHIEGEPKTNSFDKMKTFAEDLGVKLESKTVFMQDETYFLGYYNGMIKQYILRSFKN